MLYSSERAEAGQALVEYALVLALVSVVAMVGLTLLGRTASQALGRFQTNLNAYNLRHA
jgi:Flp pilus assembly pilin Flp